MRDKEMPGGSNYRILICYKTAEEQAAVVHTFLESAV
jgi:hypothetical protein